MGGVWVSALDLVMNQARGGEGRVEWASQISGTGWMMVRATGESRSGTVAEGLVLVM